MKQLVIGLGEVGQAIKNILDCEGHDPQKEVLAEGEFDVLHICFPYSEVFQEKVLGYRETFTPSLVIIHSTVPLGTSESLGAVHSPVRGVHPRLEAGIRTFMKYFGGEQAEEAAALFRKAGIETRVVASAKTSEALKLWDTTMYGWNILLEKEIYDYCQRHQLDFDVIYKHANQTYNDGYERLELPFYKKYILEQVYGPIGGHCVVQNCELLDSPISDYIKEYNASL